jgi:hypothetical protein
MVCKFLVCAVLTANELRVTPTNVLFVCFWSLHVRRLFTEGKSVDNWINGHFISQCDMKECNVPHWSTYNQINEMCQCDKFGTEECRPYVLWNRHGGTNWQMILMYQLYQHSPSGETNNRPDKQEIPCLSRTQNFLTVFPAYWTVSPCLWLSASRPTPTDRWIFMKFGRHVMSLKITSMSHFLIS